MPGYCSAANCSSTGRVDKERHFYSFPRDEGRNCCLCDKHFEDCQFLNSSKKRLIWNAVPSIFDVPNPPQSVAVKRKLPVRCYSDVASDVKRECTRVANASVTSSVTGEHAYCAEFPTGANRQSESSVSVESKDCMVLAKKIFQMQQSQPSQAVSDSQQLTVDNVIDFARNVGLNESAVNFFKAQLFNSNRGKQGRRWTQEDKVFALSLYYRSRQAYMLMQDIFCLPSKKSLLSFVGCIPSSSGLSCKLFQLMTEKVQIMNPSQRYCAVMFDEMSLRKELKYNAATDSVEGVVELLERTNEVCNQALVFMVRGLTANWKQPLGFFYSCNAASAPCLRELLLTVLQQLFEIGLKPAVIVCDQASTNRSLLASLDVTIDKPYLEMDSNKVFLTYDTPHLLKSVRNTLRKHDIVFSGEQLASWKHVQQFFGIDTQLPVRLAPKLTVKHVYLPPFAAMRVNLAAQVCSHSVYAGIRTLVALGQMDKEAENTAFFLKNVNDVFDGLNVRAYGQGVKPLSQSPVEVQWMQKLRGDVLSWQVISASGNYSRPPCFDGLVQAIDVALMLRHELVVGGEIKFLMTGRINQDCLENFFSQIRGRGGHRYNPSSKDFRYAYRSLCCRMLLTPVPSSNCEPAKVPLLFAAADHAPRTSSSASASVTDYNNRSVASVAASSINVLPVVVSACDFDVSLPVANVLQYLSGFVLSKLDCLDCSECVSALLMHSIDVVADEQLYVHLKAYSHRHSAFGGLTVPSAAVMSCMKLMHNVFQQKIAKMLGVLHILATLKQLVLETVPFNTINLCSVHKQKAVRDIVNLFLRCRLHYYLRFETQRLLKPPKSSAAVNRKARCVLHK